MHTPTVEIRQCFDAQLAIFAQGVGGLEVAWEAKKYKPKIGTKYLRPYLLFSKTTIVTLGTDGFERLSGIYQVNVEVPKDEGPNSYEVIARDLVDFFRGGKKLDCCDYFVITITVAQVGTKIEDEDRNTCPVSVSWYCYTQKDAQ